MKPLVSIRLMVAISLTVATLMWAATVRHERELPHGSVVYLQGVA